MAIVRTIGKKLYVQYYDPLKKKVDTQSTGYEATARNKKTCQKIANELQRKISEKYEKIKKSGFSRVTLEEAYLHFLRNNYNKHPKTKKDYHRFYTKFTEHFDTNMPCAVINKMNVEGWLIEIQRLPLSKNSIHCYGKQLNHFLNFLFEYNYTPMFKINKQVKTRPEIKEKIVFSDENIETIFMSLERKNFNFRLAVNMLFYTGLRSSDLLSITSDSIDLKDRSIKYYSPKRKKYREIAFHDDLLPLLKEALSSNATGPLIRYKSLEILSRSVYRFFKKIKIYKTGFSVRTFRKTFITLCRSRYSMDASIVRELVGHEHGNTTDKYYNSITVMNMREELRKFRNPYRMSPNYVNNYVRNLDSVNLTENTLKVEQKLSNFAPHP